MERKHARTKKRDFYSLHQKHWDWLFNHPTKKKTDSPVLKEWEKVNGPLKNGCFACEYTLIDEGNGFEPDCSCCLLQWPKNDEGVRVCSNFGAELGTMQERWNAGKSKATKKKWAGRIRDLLIRDFRVKD